MDLSDYTGREQTYVKHRILQRYLTRFAIILGQSRPSITYVDCFSGPWKSQDDDYSDTSFAIAIEQLRIARDEVASRFAKQVHLRAFFLEKDKASYSRLAAYAAGIDDVEIETHNDTLENSIPTILEFVQRERTFPFIFIDPTGWTGFSLKIIKPLLTLSPSEVLINFMTQHVVRFVDSDPSRKSFESLFGTGNIIDAIRGASGDDRVDQVVFAYRDIVSRTGGFDYAGISPILNPLKDRPHFHLIYLTRNPTGLQKFKECEKSSMKDMEAARERAKTNKRIEKTGQSELFGLYDDDTEVESPYYHSLRDRYLQLATNGLQNLLANNGGQVLYDDAWAEWLRVPLVWDTDLKIAIAGLGFEIEGLGKNERTPKRKQNHWVRVSQ